MPLLDSLLCFFALFAERNNNWPQFGIIALTHKSAGEITLTFQTAVLEGENAEEIRRQYINPILTELNNIHPYQLMSKPGISQLSQVYHHSVDTEYYTLHEVVQTLNGSGPNRRGKYRSAYMRKAFPIGQVRAICDWLIRIPEGLSEIDMNQSLLQVDTYGGQINTVAPGDRAVPQRS